MGASHARDHSVAHMGGSYSRFFRLAKVAMMFSTCSSVCAALTLQRM